MLHFACPFSGDISCWSAAVDDGITPHTSGGTCKLCIEVAKAAFDMAPNGEKEEEGFRHMACSGPGIMISLKRAERDPVVPAIPDSENKRHIHCILKTDALPVLEALDCAQWKGYPTTLLHFMGRAAARALVKLPDSRGRDRKGIDVFFVNGESRGAAATGTRVQRVDRKSVLEISNELEFCKGSSSDAPSDCAVVSQMMPRRLPFRWTPNVPLWIVFSEKLAKAMAAGGTATFGYMLPITLIAERRHLDGGRLYDAISAFREYLDNPISFEPAYQG